MRGFALVACVVALTPAAAVSQAPADAGRPVAILAEVQGPAWAMSGASKRDVRRFDWFSAGTTLSTGDGAALVVVFVNGGRTRLGERSRLRITPDGPADPKGTVAALAPVPALPRVGTVPLEGPATRINAVRVRGEAFARLYPDRAVVLVADARLEFEPTRDLAPFAVAIERDDATVAYRSTTSETTLLVPDGVLAPGATYHWRVTAQDASGTRAEAAGRFVTATVEQTARRQLLRAHLESDPGHAVFLAEIDRSLGLLREARSGYLRAWASGDRSELVSDRLRELDTLLPRLR